MAERVRGLKNEGAYAVLAAAQALERQGRHIVHLEIGQPAYPTPEHVVEAGKVGNPPRAWGRRRPPAASRSSRCRARCSVCVALRCFAWVLGFGLCGRCLVAGRDRCWADQVQRARWHSGVEASGGAVRAGHSRCKRARGGGGDWPRSQAWCAPFTGARKPLQGWLSLWLLWLLRLLLQVLWRRCCVCEARAATNEVYVCLPGVGLFFPALALISPGDEVIYPDPGFPTYEAMVRVAGAQLYSWSCI